MFTNPTMPCDSQGYTGPSKEPSEITFFEGPIIFHPFKALRYLFNRLACLEEMHTLLETETLQRQQTITNTFNAKIKKVEAQLGKETDKVDNRIEEIVIEVNDHVNGHVDLSSLEDKVSMHDERIDMLEVIVQKIQKDADTKSVLNIQTNGKETTTVSSNESPVN